MREHLAKHTLLARRFTLCSLQVAGFPVVPPSAEGLAEEPLAKLKDALGAEAANLRPIKEQAGDDPEPLQSVKTVG